MGSVAAGALARLSPARLQLKAYSREILGEVRRLALQQVLHGPVHHPFEHGKDIVALDRDGNLHAFQLKAGDLSLAALEEIQAQLFALSATAVNYPGVEPPRRPDRAFLITNGRLSAPARDRIKSLNDANRPNGLPPIEVVERDHLLPRFVKAHGKLLPEELPNFNDLLRFALSDGLSLFPSYDRARLLSSLVPLATEDPRSDLRRAVGSVTLLTAYTVGPWQRVQNHLGVAEGWLTLALVILRVAETSHLPIRDWESSFLLARDGARQALRDLLMEASGGQDLVVTDVVDGIVYPTRAALVCGYCSALYISEKHIGQDSPISESIRALLLREIEFIKVHGEAAVPHLWMIATALELLGETAKAVELVIHWAEVLARANHIDSKEPFLDPYHSIESILLNLLGQDSDIGEENCAGEAFTLHIAIEWLARRDLREHVEKIWPSVTHVHFAEFAPSRPANLLAHDDPDGEKLIWAPEAPASWKKLRSEACVFPSAAIPSVLWNHAEVLPYLPLIFPFRLTSAVAKAVDYLAHGPCMVIATSQDYQTVDHNNGELAPRLPQTPDEDDQPG